MSDCDAFLKKHKINSLRKWRAKLLNIKKKKGKDFENNPEYKKLTQCKEYISGNNNYDDDDSDSNDSELDSEKYNCMMKLYRLDNKKLAEEYYTQRLLNDEISDIQDVISYDLNKISQGLLFIKEKAKDMEKNKKLITDYKAALQSKVELIKTSQKRDMRLINLYNLCYTPKKIYSRTYSKYRKIYNKSKSQSKSNICYTRQL